MRWPNKDTDKKDMNGRSKNFPKLHMAKIPAEGHLDRQAVQRVCVLLEQDRVLEEIKFIVPASFRNGDETSYGGYLEDHDSDPKASHLRLQRIKSLDWLKKTVVVEKDGYLAVRNSPQLITDLGWDLVCLPGSFIWETCDEKGIGSTDFEKHEVIHQRTWRAISHDLDYLDGIKWLFRREEEISVHANDGKHRRKTQKVNLERELRGFESRLNKVVEFQQPCPPRCRLPLL